MSESGNVIPLFPEQDEYDGLVCKCGSAWWSCEVVVDTDGKVTGYTTPLRCVECDAKWTPPVPVIGG